MNGFKFDFSKIFWGGAHRAPSPRTPPPAFSRASPSVRASPSILGRFAPSTRASPSTLGRFAPSIRASPSTFDWGPWFGPPQNKFLDPPLRPWERKAVGVDHSRRYWNAGYDQSQGRRPSTLRCIGLISKGDIEPQPSRQKLIRNRTASRLRSDDRSRRYVQYRTD